MYEVGNKVCIWFDIENGQRMGIPGGVTDVSEGKVTVEYYALGEMHNRVFSEEQAKTSLTKATRQDGLGIPSK